MNITLAAIGEVLWDIFPDGARFGGAPANVASHAAALGADAAMVSCVGNDDLGQRAVEALRSRHVNTDAVIRSDDYPTGTVTVQLDETGKPQFTIGQPAAWDHLAWSDLLQQLAARCDAVCFGSLGQRNQASRDVIHRFVTATPSSALRVCDVNLRRPFVDHDVIRASLEVANVLKLSDEELNEIAQACGYPEEEESVVLARLLHDWQLQLVAVTRGSGGATLLSSQRRSDCQGTPVTVKDTVGAGDAFTAAMICGRLQGIALDDITRHACRVASYVCTQSGATPPLPDEMTSWTRT